MANTNPSKKFQPGVSGNPGGRPTKEEMRRRKLAGAKETLDEVLFEALQSLPKDVKTEKNVHKKWELIIKVYDMFGYELFPKELLPELNKAQDAKRIEIVFGPQPAKSPEVIELKAKEDETNSYE